MAGRGAAQHQALQVSGSDDRFAFGPPERPLFGCTDLQILQWLNNPAACPATYAQLLGEYRLRRDRATGTRRNPGDCRRTPPAA